MSARSKKEVTKTSRNDGETVTPIAVQIADTGWTQVLAASPSRRRASLQILSGANYVCLSSDNTSATECVAATAGARLEPTAETPAKYDYFSEKALYARAFKGGGAVYVYGLDYTDSKDGGVE